MGWLIDGATPLDLNQEFFACDIATSCNLDAEIEAVVMLLVNWGDDPGCVAGGCEDRDCGITGHMSGWTLREDA